MSNSDDKYAIRNKLIDYDKRKTSNGQATKFAKANLARLGIGADAIEASGDLVKKLVAKTGHSCLVEQGGFIHLLLGEKMKFEFRHRSLRRALASAPAAGTVLASPR